MPALRASRSNVMRVAPVVASVPMKPSPMPMQAAMAPFKPESLDTLAMSTREKMMTANTSGGPIKSVTMAMGPMSARVKMSDSVSPMVEENSAISSAFRPWPLRVSAGPSKVVAMDAPVPGMPTRMAGMLPP